MRVYDCRQNKFVSLNWCKANKLTEAMLCSTREEDYWVPRLMKYWGMTREEALSHCQKIRAEVRVYGGLK